jgi:hypothetical protein
MDTRAILFGMMLAFTPSMVVTALLLWKSGHSPENRRGHTSYGLDRFER